MSVPFSNTTLKNGLIQIIERRLGWNDGDISGNATLLAYFTAEINLTVDEVFGFLFPMGGMWQLDDSNQTDYPIITRSIVSGQRDYTFTTDETGNVILDIYKVMVANSSGVFSEIKAKDQQTLNNNNSNTDTYIDGQNTSGTPTSYDKTANGFFLDPVPNYTRASALKVHINREATRFVVGDTTKTVGFAHLYHEYFALAPTYKYALSHDFENTEKLKRDTLELREAIKTYYGNREKDVIRRMHPNVENCR